MLRALRIHRIFGVPGTKKIALPNGSYCLENQVIYTECLGEESAIGTAVGPARRTGLPGALALRSTLAIVQSIEKYIFSSQVMVERPRAGYAHPQYSEGWGGWIASRQRYGLTTWLAS